MEIIGHHTCKKDGGEEFVKKESPFLSSYNPRRNNLPFLGSGYYYWDDNFEVAKWWGELKYKNGFFIVESKMKLSGDIFFDLVGNRQHMKLFVSLAKRFREKAYKSKNLKMGEFIEFLKYFAKQYDSSIFPFLAIRAIDNSAPEVKRFSLEFVLGKKNYTNLKPRLVICLLEKEFVPLLHKNIVYGS